MNHVPGYQLVSLEIVAFLVLYWFLNRSERKIITAVFPLFISLVVSAYLPSQDILLKTVLYYLTAVVVTTITEKRLKHQFQIEVKREMYLRMLPVIIVGGVFCGIISTLFLKNSLSGSFLTLLFLAPVFAFIEEFLFRYSITEHVALRYDRDIVIVFVSLLNALFWYNGKISTLLVALIISLVLNVFYTWYRNISGTTTMNTIMKWTVHLLSSSLK
jgi:membrane protease YdiL (CAAX protease family)